MSQAILVKPNPVARPFLDSITREGEAQVNRWIAACDRFLEWQRATVLRAEPSAETLAEHRQSLLALLRYMRFLQTLVSDPDVPLNRLAPLLAIRISQLEDSWEMVYNPMPEAEAAKIARECFPDEPLARSLFPEAFAQ